jgi:uncharacterized protein (TIGR03790 family)
MDRICTLQLSPQLVFTLMTLVTCSIPTTSQAALSPTEIAIIAAKNSEESLSLAEYYCQQRGVPIDNICFLNFPKGEVLNRDKWELAIRPTIQSWLSEHDPQKKIRCLVTTWDVPLKISKAKPNDDQKDYYEFLVAERDNRLLVLKRIAADLTDLGTSKAKTAKLVNLDSEDNLQTMQTRLDAAFRTAQRAIAEVSSDDQKQQISNRIQQLAIGVGGSQTMLQALEGEIAKQQVTAPSELYQQADILRGRSMAFAESKSILDDMPMGMMRDQAVLLNIERLAGLLGTVEWLDQEIQLVKKNENGASLDSELSLVMWPEKYQLIRWQPNYLNARYDNSQLRHYKRTLMVARLDGPSFEIAKRLIDDAIAVEKAGRLKGNIYLDGRGLAEADDPPQQAGGFEDYDRSLMLAAKNLKEWGQMKIVVNQLPALLQQGDCPETALYCGWYSVGKYVDAFEFSQGAVAFHMASFEAVSLRDPKSTAWCKSLLSDGACATIGPVFEPYLGAFPYPEAFFNHLVLQHEQLVEAYYRTLPFNSWMMTLIGDPLYRPFPN